MSSPAFRKFATAAAAGAIIVSTAPFANAAPAPKPADPNLLRAVPGTSCNVAQLRASIRKSSPSVLAKLDQAAGGQKQFADIATSDPATRQFQLAALAFTTSGAGLGILSEQQNVQNAVSEAYRSCAKK